MKVKELIAELQHYDSEAEVVINPVDAGWENSEILNIEQQTSGGDCCGGVKSTYVSLVIS